MNAILLPILLLLQATPVADSIDALFRRAYASDGPGASVIVVRNGDVLLHRGYGLADVSSGTPMRADSPHKIGSISKQFTAAAVLDLVNQGKLDLDKTVEDYFPGLYPYGNTIAVRHLLTHTSGIPSYTNLPSFMDNMAKSGWTPRSIGELTAGMPPEFAPGDRWHYNNTAYVLLGGLIEAATGMTYKTYMESVFLPKAGLKATLVGDAASVAAMGTTGYSPSDDGFVVAAAIDMGFPGAAGNLISTVRDLYDWTLAVDAGRVIPKASVEQAWTSALLNNGEETGYGYGWSVNRFLGHRVIEHGGGIPGWVTSALWLPEQKVFVAVLGNRDGGDPNPQALAYEAAALAAGLDLYPPAKPLPADAAAYAGMYVIDESTHRVISIEDGQAFSHRTGSTKLAITHIGDDTFYYPGSMSRVRFLRDATGAVTSMEFDPGNGRPTIHAKTDRPLPSGPVEIAIDPLSFDPFVGEYELAPNFILRIWREGSEFWTQATGQQAIRIYPESPTRFFLKVVPAAVEFAKNEQGEVTHLTLYQAGRAMPARKIN